MVFLSAIPIHTALQPIQVLLHTADLKPLKWLAEIKHNLNPKLMLGENEMVEFLGILF